MMELTIFNDSRDNFETTENHQLSDYADYHDFNQNQPKEIDLEFDNDNDLMYMFSQNDQSASVNDTTSPNCTDGLKFLLEMNQFSLPSQIIVPVIYCIICFIGLVGNGLVMFVIFGSKEMTKTIANIYIWNLAVADTLFLVTLPFTSTQRLLLSWPFGSGMCKIVEAIKYLNYFASIFFLTAMSIDRYIAVVHVVKSNRWRTSRNTFFVCAAIWLVSLVIVSPLLIYTQVHEDMCALVFNQQGSQSPWEAEFEINIGFDEDEIYYASFPDDCEKVSYNDYAGVAPYGDGETAAISGDFDFHNPLAGLEVTSSAENETDDMSVVCKHADSKTFHVFLIFTFVIGFLIPFFIITVCYIMIIVRLLQPSETRTRSKHAERTRKKVTRMVIALVITFFICWLPFYIWHLVQIKGIRATIGVCHNVRDLTFCLGYANSCLNPILYTFLGHNFQERLRKSIAISLRSFSFTTFTKYTTNTMSRVETQPQSRKLDTSYSEQNEALMRINQPLCQVKEDTSSSHKKSDSPDNALNEEKM